MRHSKLVIFLVVLLILAVVLPTACSQTTETTTSKPAASTTTSAPVTTTPSAPQVFTTNLTGEPDTIDPNLSQWDLSLSVIYQCFDGLLGYNTDLSLKAVTATQIPTLANGGISADGLTYTFKLRNDVTWSDGQKVLAKDYVFSIKRMLSPELAAPYASFYTSDIVGAADYNAADHKDTAKSAALKAAVGVKALDDYTLEIKLAQPRPVFLLMMALWPAYPLREDLITKYGDKWTEPPNFIGDGPFMLTEWVHQDHMTFKPNPNYWGTKPQLTQITFKMITDVNAELAGYKNNELQQSRIPPGTEKSSMADATINKQIYKTNELSTSSIQFNVKKAPFDNVKVRQAFATAIDRATLVNDVRNGLGKVALSWIPPGMPGYDPNLGKEYDFNAAKAKQLLADAGYADVSKLPEIKFTFADSAGNRTIGQFIQGQIKTSLGITITLDPMETKAFQKYTSPKSMQHQMAWIGWGADYPDPDNWLPELFGTGAGNNQTAYSNPAFDALCVQGKKELDNTKRLQIWADAQKMIMADVPLVPIVYRERLGVLSPTVKGFTMTAMDGVSPGDRYFRNLSIAK
jgi:oligopeptide transport system substrate-binding protein